MGGVPRPLPDGLARSLPQESDLVLQMHFHPTGKVEHETAVVGLHFADAPPKRTLAGLQLPPLFGALAGIDIPAGEKRFVIKDSFTLPIDIEVISVGGHACGVEAETGDAYCWGPTYTCHIYTSTAADRIHKKKVSGGGMSFRSIGRGDAAACGGEPTPVSLAAGTRNSLCWCRSTHVFRLNLLHQRVFGTSAWGCCRSGYPRSIRGKGLEPQRGSGTWGWSGTFPVGSGWSGTTLWFGAGLRLTWGSLLSPATPGSATTGLP